MLNISITEGGCSKPGHTAYTSDEGTCYCLTCELEQQNAALKAQVERLSAPLSHKETERIQTGKHYGHDSLSYLTVCKELIASRLAEKGEQG